MFCRHVIDPWTTALFAFCFCLDLDESPHRMLRVPCPCAFLSACSI